MKMFILAALLLVAACTSQNPGSAPISPVVTAPQPQPPPVTTPVPTPTVGPSAPVADFIIRSRWRERPAISFIDRKWVLTGRVRAVGVQPELPGGMARFDFAPRLNLATSKLEGPTFRLVAPPALGCLPTQPRLVMPVDLTDEVLIVTPGREECRQFLEAVSVSGFEYGIWNVPVQGATPAKWVRLVVEP